MEFSTSPVISCEDGVSEINSTTGMDDIIKWWDSLSVLLKSCFTTTRVDLEVPKQDSESIIMWTVSSTADILASGGRNLLFLILM